MNIALLTIIYVLLNMTSLLAAKGQEPPVLTADNLAELSKYWPTRVHLKDTVEVEHKGKLITLNPRFRNTLVRIEGDQVILDTGRFGIHSFPIAQTDALEVAQSIATGSIQKPDGIIAQKLGYSVFRISRSAEFVGVPIEEFRSLEYIILLYADATEHSDSDKLILKLIAEYEEHIANNDKAEILMVNLDNDFPPVIEREYTPFIMTYRHSSAGFRNALYHKPEAPTLVLVDPDGKVLYHSRDSNGRINDTDKAWEVIKTIIDQATD